MRFALAALALAFSLGSVAHAATPCRDAKGKYVKCATVAPKTKCRDSGGKFIKCPG